MGTAIFQGVVWLGEPEPTQTDGRCGAIAQATFGKPADQSAPPHHQRSDGRIKLENPKHQAGGPRLPQLPKLPDSYPVLLRKTQPLSIMTHEETFVLKITVENLEAIELH